jgi:hypothetical protein
LGEADDTNSISKQQDYPNPIEVMSLADDGAWPLIKSLMQGTADDGVANSIQRQMTDAGAVSVVIETDYLDRDFSAEFSEFYSKLFSRYRRQTQRVHFFAVPLPNGPPSLLRERLKELAEESGSPNYLGFVVLRPVKDAPVGRTVLRMCRKEKQHDSSLDVRSTFSVHLLGVQLEVLGLPFVQQDSRVTACAQTSIWTCGRHFQNKHGGPWKSSVDITADAIHPADHMLASSLPAGTEALNDDHIVRALVAMGRHPIVYFKKSQARTDWPGTIDPVAVVARYVCSGIPVIIGLGPWKKGQTVGHTVVAHGCVLKVDSKPVLGARRDWSELLTHLYVHDDQLGPNLRMPLSGAPEGEYSLREHCVAIIVPLPNKVFVTAETVDTAAWHKLEEYQRDWLAHKASAQVGTDTTKGDEAVAHIKAGRVLARTTLTFGWKYKRRLLESDAASDVKEKVAITPLPRMVWVTEFGADDDLRTARPEDRRIFAHSVVDATSTGPDRETLIFHAPNFLWIDRPIEPKHFEKLQTYMFEIRDDKKYLPRQRDFI